MSEPTTEERIAAVFDRVMANLSPETRAAIAATSIGTIVRALAAEIVALEDAIAECCDGRGGETP